MRYARTDLRANIVVSVSSCFTSNSQGAVRRRGIWYSLESYNLISLRLRISSSYRSNCVYFLESNYKRISISRGRSSNSNVSVAKPMKLQAETPSHSFTLYSLLEQNIPASRCEFEFGTRLGCLFYYEFSVVECPVSRPICCSFVCCFNHFMQFLKKNSAK